MLEMLHIRPAILPDDYDAVWEIFHRVVMRGDTYAFDPHTPKEALHQLWFASYMSTWVAVLGERLVGTYTIKPNHTGLGSHIANASYMVHPDWQGKGIGKQLCKHSLDIARQQGYLGMQFNLVVSTNETAIRLWRKMGFRIIGTIPKGFRHTQLGWVDAYVMFREL